MLAFAEVMISQITDAPVQDASEVFYQQARPRWAEIVELALYDDEQIILDTIPLLESALTSNPDHVASLSLLSELFIMLEAYEEANNIVVKLRVLEPDNEVHATKQELLKHVSTFDERFDLKYWVLEKRWRQGDW